MAEIFVSNTLNPFKTVKFNISLKKFVGAENEGESKYYLEIGTTYSGIYKEGINTTYSGSDGIVHIRPVYIDKINYDNLNEELKNVVGYLCDYIDWDALYTDKQAPYASEITPVGPDTSIFSNMYITIEDAIPSTGIDLSEMEVILDNGVQEFNITNEIKVNGDPFKYVLEWSPPIRVLDT